MRLTQLAFGLVAALPDDLREDLEDFVYAMGAPDSSAARSSGAQQGPAQKRQRPPCLPARRPGGPARKPVISRP
jgi:hypothetical protein